MSQLIFQSVSRRLTSCSADDPHLYSTLMSLFVSSKLIPFFCNPGFSPDLWAGRGLGNVLSGPLSTTLLKHSPLYDKARFGYGLKGYVRNTSVDARKTPLNVIFRVLLSYSRVAVCWQAPLPSAIHTFSTRESTSQILWQGARLPQGDSPTNEARVLTYLCSIHMVQYINKIFMSNIHITIKWTQERR